MAVAVEERQLVAPVTAACFTEDRNWVLSGCGPYLRVHPTRADQGGLKARPGSPSTRPSCVCHARSHRTCARALPS